MTKKEKTVDLSLTREEATALLEALVSMHRACDEVNRARERLDQSHPERLPKPDRQVIQMLLATLARIANDLSEWNWSIDPLVQRATRIIKDSQEQA